MDGKLIVRRTNHVIGGLGLSVCFPGFPVHPKAPLPPGKVEEPDVESIDYVRIGELPWQSSG